MAFNKFQQAAKDATTLSELIANREKVAVKDIITAYPNGIHIIGFDMFDAVDKKTHAPITLTAFIFAEDPGVFFFGGYVLKKISDAWLDACGGDIDACNKELSEVGGCLVKMRYDVTSTGNNVVVCEIC